LPGMSALGIFTDLQIIKPKTLALKKQLRDNLERREYRPEACP
jgi:hypothetical protein